MKKFCFGVLVLWMAFAATFDVKAQCPSCQGEWCYSAANITQGTVRIIPYGPRLVIFDF